MKLTPGKLAGLKAVSNEHGVIAAAAMDQRGSLQKSIAKERGGSASADDLSTFKILVTEVLTRHASAILLDPEYGYYITRDPFGAAGDFITAPEISQMFGELMGLWAAVTWQSMGCPSRVMLVELGPGRGTLMADALRAAAMVPPFAAALEIWLVEASPTLRRKQEQTLAKHKIHWAERVEDLPPGPMLLIANEFFDALRHFRRRLTDNLA